MCFDEFIIGHTCIEANNATYDDDDMAWQSCLEAYGLDSDFIQGIMDPRFRELRLAESAFFWAKDTIEVRYRGLREIQAASRQRAMALQRLAGRNPDSQSSIAQTARQSISGAQQDANPGISWHSWTSASAIARRNTPGVLTLYKALDQARLLGLFDANGNVVNIGALLSLTPSDFSPSQALFYFTPDYQVAEYYAAQVKLRAPPVSVVIIVLQIPNLAIEQLATPAIQQLFYPDPQWKELIWNSRRSQHPPQSLKAYQKTTLIIGTTSKKPDSSYHALQSWSDVDSTCVLRVAGRTTPMIQYAFSGKERGVKFLTEHTVNSLHCFPFHSTEAEAWFAQNPPAY